MNTSVPSPNLDPVAFNDRVSAAVRSHRIKIRLLTSLASILGFLAVATSVFFVWFYLIMYLPKQRELLKYSEAAAIQNKNLSAEDAVKRMDMMDKVLGVQIFFTHVISAGVTITAIAVGVLGLGTLILLTVVILNRRATLNQINASLAQISDQLRQLQDDRGTGLASA